MLPDDLIYSILEYMTIEELRKMRLVSKEWKKMVDNIRIQKLKDRVVNYNMHTRFHRWALYKTLMINSKKNFISWQSKKKAEDSEILLF